MATADESALATRVRELRRRGVPEADAIRHAHAIGVQMPPKISIPGVQMPKIQMPPHVAMPAQRAPSLEQMLLRRRAGQEPAPRQAQGIIATD
jgi:hypothetical protein